MKKTNIYKYYAFGYNYRIIHSDGLSDFTIKKANKLLSEFLESIDELDLEVTKKVSENLILIQKELSKNNEEKTSKELSDKIK